MQAKTWSDERDAFTAMELHGATVGIVGYGALGKQIARLCHALGMKIMVLRRSGGGTQDENEAPVTFVSREELPALMHESDFVVLATPITPETHHMIDAAMLAQMKPTAFLVNIGRGAVVDEAAMIVALRERRIAGAGLDVFEQEPLPDDSELWTLDNVILSPHISGLTPQYPKRASEIFVGNLRRYVAGEPLVNQVDFQRGY
jgi:phosphoglycerate dehydrogenase-like enzyme